MASILLLNLTLIFLTFLFLKKKFSDDHTGSLLKHLGALEAAWTGFLFILGLFIFFDILEAKRDHETFLAIATPEKKIQLSLLFGFGITHLSIFAAIVTKLFRKRFVN
jgi:hypothetical protein